MTEQEEVKNLTQQLAKHRDAVQAAASALSVVGTASAGVEAKNLMDPKYGAKGNAIDDDTNAINAALADSVGRQLRVPVGRYKTTSPIFLPNGVYIKGDAHNGGAFLEGGCSFEGAFGNDFVFRADGEESKSADGRYQRLENLGVYGWGGIFSRSCTHMNISNCSFGCHQCIILPECWTSKISNVTLGPGDLSAGNTGILVWGSAGCFIDTVDVCNFDRGVVLNGNGVELKNFRIETNNRGIVLGEFLDGTKDFVNACKVGIGTMEANNIAIHVRQANVSKIGPVLIQGHEHPGFGVDGMCGTGLQLDNLVNSIVECVTAGGGFAMGALIDNTEDKWGNIFQCCNFYNGMTVRGAASPGDVMPAGSTVITLARGSQTAMPPWMKIGLLVLDINANSADWSYPTSGVAGAFAPDTTITAIGQDSITISQPTLTDIQGMRDDLSGGWTGQSAVGFFDSRGAKVGGVFMTPDNLARTLLQQNSRPFDVVP